MSSVLYIEQVAMVNTPVSPQMRGYCVVNLELRKAVYNGLKLQNLCIHEISTILQY